MWGGLLEDLAEVLAEYPTCRLADVGEDGGFRGGAADGEALWRLVRKLFCENNLRRPFSRGGRCGARRNLLYSAFPGWTRHGAA